MSLIKMLRNAARKGRVTVRSQINRRERSLHPRFPAAFVDRDCRSRWGAHLHMVHLSAERVRHVPVIRRRVAWNARAPLHILAVDFAVTTDVRADRAAGDRA